MLTPYQKDLLLQGEREIDESLDEADEVVPFKYSITSYGADYPVDGLVKRISNQDIIIPKFQRGYVWSLKEASRFVESLLLGLPVPSIFLSKEAESRKLLVIDGQQRLLSLRYFYEGIWPSTGREFALRSVISKHEGTAYLSLTADDRRRLDDSIIHAVIIQQDGPSADSSTIAEIFERLNAGGVSLTAQEIRNAIYHGAFSGLLEELNAVEAWRAIYGSVNRLMRDQELIVRFFALYYDAAEYRQPLKGFLSTFMGKNKNVSSSFREEMASIFQLSVQTIHKSIGKRAFRLGRVLNAAVFDAVMVGLARRLERGAVKDLTTLRQRYETLLQDRSFLAAVDRSTASVESVSKRLELATAAFADIA